eukprot:m.9067 g.9067  ORF g.9067 m.9067 type:complete len:61 (+) comp6168_c1_seq1:94-276(+)
MQRWRAVSFHVYNIRLRLSEEREQLVTIIDTIQAFNGEMDRQRTTRFHQHVFLYNWTGTN